MNTTTKRLFTAACVTMVGLTTSFSSLAYNDMPGGPAVRQLNFSAPVTKIMEDIHWLHWFMMIICTVIFIAVFGAMFYSIFKHRKSKGSKPADFHESTTVEIIWTIIPLIIVIGMALPATKTVVAMKDTTNADITIKATGYQWKWAMTISRVREKVLLSFQLCQRHVNKLIT